MATILTGNTGSPLCGNPIVYTVQAGAYTNPTFHRVKMKVHAGMQGEDYQSIQMSVPVVSENHEEIPIDVSSALRAVADNYEFTPTPPTYYPYISYFLEAWDEYMINGEVYESAHDFYPDVPSGASAPVNPFRSLMGKYSDMERILAGESKQTQKFSRKPSTSPEIVMVGETYVRPAEMQAHSGNITHGPQSVVYDISNEGLQTIGGATVYALPAGQKDRYQFRFINSLGVMESLSVHSLRETDVNIDSDQHMRSTTETFNKFSRGVVIKQNDYETWQMSSGPVDAAWQSWYIHEFLMARYVWINLRTTSSPLWVACHILPEEKVAGLNRRDMSGMEVLFSVKLDIEGSPLSDIAV